MQIKSMNDLKNQVTSILTSNDDEKDQEQINMKLQKIKAKLENGKHLTREEMDFLQKYSPQLYMVAKELEIMRQSVKNRIECCSSKEEVNDVLTTSIGAIPKQDENYAMKVAAVEDEVKEFQKTDEYQKLPNTKEEAENKKHNRNNNQVKYDIKFGEYQMAYVEDENQEDNE